MIKSLWRNQNASYPALAGIVVVAGIGIVVLAILPGVATSSWSEPVIRVEEDWRLVLNEPSDMVDAPQFHTAMSPFENLDDAYLQATWNYWELPEFVPGGLQLQGWNADEWAVEKGFHEAEQLSTDAETITWTQVLTTNGEVISFGIENGQSVTWGAFGGDNMKIQGYLHLPSLNGYDPEVSKANSWITYGDNRVDVLMITEVRYYGASGLLYRDTTPRIVFQSDLED